MIESSNKILNYTKGFDLDKFLSDDKTPDEIHNKYLNKPAFSTYECVG